MKKTKNTTSKIKFIKEYLPCPWCGAQPRVFQEGRMRCSNDECQSIYRSRMTAKEWNTRYDPNE